VFALGLGIGLSTLVFSITQGAMLRGPPFPEPEEIVRIDRLGQEGGRTIPTLHDYAAWSEGTQSFAALGAYFTNNINVRSAGASAPEFVRGAIITPSVLELLGVQPVMGRLFNAADTRESAEPVMLISWEVWQRVYQGDRAVIGRTLRANGVETVIVGVLPEGFGFPETEQMWRPLRMNASSIAWGSGERVQVIGRLRAGVAIAAADTDLDRIAARLAQEHPETHRNLTVHVSRFGELGDDQTAMLFIMLAAVAAVLLIACVNVANLLIGRAITRTKEVGVRIALGASRYRVALPFLTESVILAACGALLGIAVAYGGLVIFNRTVELHNPPFWIFFAIDRAVLTFVAVATAVAAILAGVIPALQAARLSLPDTLKDESRGATGFRLGRVSRGLVIAEIALSLGLLVGAGLMIRSVVKLNTIELGVDGEKVFVTRVALPQATYPDPEARRLFAAELWARLQTLPGARTVALSSTLPGPGGGPSSAIAMEGSTRADGSAAAYAMVPTVSAGYFQTFAAQPLRGRDFSPADDAGALPVAIVNRSFERKYFTDGNALGRRIRVASGGSENSWLTVVGVVPDLLESGVQNWRPEVVYRPIGQNPISYVRIVVHTSANTADFTRPVRDVVHAIDPDLALYQTNTLRGAVADANFITGIVGGLFTAFGSAALVLASIGLYGVMSFSVGQRRREVGVRMALGAKPLDVLSLILRQGMRQVLFGLAIGAFLAYALARGIAASLFGISPQDPLTLVGTTLLLVTVAAVACAVPALRATRTDPLEALRSE
jgi:predicted permease